MTSIVGAATAKETNDRNGPIEPLNPEQSFQDRYTEGVRGMRPSIIRELLRWAQDPEVIYMAGGLPARETFPTREKILEITGLAYDRYPSLMQYDQTAGLPGFLEILAGHVRRQGYVLSAEKPTENLIITVGSQQMLDHVGKTFISRGDRIIVPRPCYLGALDAFEQYGAEFVEVATDEEGIDPDDLKKILERDQLIKFMYVVSTHDNPTGKTLSDRRRRALAQLVNYFGLPTFEDNPYDELIYDPGEAVVPLQHYAPDWVMGAKTFSKIFAPGFRIGIGILPQWYRRVVELIQQRTNLQPSTYTQALAAVYMSGGYYAEQLPRTIALYRERRDVMLDACQTYMSDVATWTRPKGGMFLWLTVPGANQADVLKRAFAKKVAVVPGAPFYATDGDKEPTFRLNFSNMPPDRIEEGIKRLGAAVRESIDPTAIFVAP